MKNRVVRLNESDLEKLVQKIIREDEKMGASPEMDKKPLSTSGLKKDIKQTSSDLSGLSGIKKEYVGKLNQLIQKMSGPEQIPAGAKPLLDKLFNGFNIK
jgi:hypothetical protein